MGDAELVETYTHTYKFGIYPVDREEEGIGVWRAPSEHPWQVLEKGSDLYRRRRSRVLRRRTWLMAASKDCHKPLLGAPMRGNDNSKHFADSRPSRSMEARKRLRPEAAAVRFLFRASPAVMDYGWKGPILSVNDERPI